MITEPLNQLLEKEVDRKEFLLYAGFLLLTITGISGVLKNISSITQGQAKQQAGFGGGSYGK